jgi:CRISPR/Cas system CMR subunit Cmr6 (Cas7 group RAMP superfamily)
VPMPRATGMPDRPTPARVAAGVAPRPGRARPTPARGPDRNRALGPLGGVVAARGGTVAVPSDANALVLLRRVAFWAGDGLDRDGETALLHWAATSGLGQDSDLVAAVSERRTRAVAACSARERRTLSAWRRVLVSPEWRLVTGLGEDGNPHEIGIALHGTYGWPVIPGSTIKGAARAWAEEQGADAVDRVCGPRAARDDRARAGTVHFLDALPAGAPVTVVRDVVTPHNADYHAGGIPGEWQNPVPNPFLAVGEGAFAIDLVGPERDVELAAEWCRGACDDLGIGAKTAAGYGYLTAANAHDEGGAR